VLLTSKRIQRIAEDEQLWKWYCMRDFKISQIHLWNGWTFRQFYTEALFKYSYLFGFWRRNKEQRPGYGGLLIVKMEEGGFFGYECLPPLNDTHLGIQELQGLIRISETADYSRESLNRLRFSRVFALKPIDGGVQAFCCHSSVLHGPDRDQEAFPHICDGACNTAVLIERSESRLAFGYSCQWCRNNRESDLEYWFQQEYGFRVTDPENVDRALDYVSPNSSVAKRQRYTAIFSNQTLLQDYSALTVQRNVPNTYAAFPVKPGLYNGMYGHNWEIFNFLYKNDGNELKGINVTGDPHVVPAGKMTVRGFLSRPLLMTKDDLATCRAILEAKHRPAPENTSVLEAMKNLQHCFRLPADCTCDRPLSEIPRFCRSFHLAIGYTPGLNRPDTDREECLFVVFEEDYFGVLWLTKRVLTLFFRGNNVDV